MTLAEIFKKIDAQRQQKLWVVRVEVRGREVRHEFDNGDFPDYGDHV